MSQENVNVARQCIDAYNRRDLDALRALNHPDLELDWTKSRSWLAGVYQGRDAALRFYQDYFDAFEDILIEPDCFMDAGDSVVIPNVSRLRGRDGIEVLARSALLVTLRDRKLIRVCLHQETADALAATGLRE